MNYTYEATNLVFDLYEARHINQVQLALMLRVLNYAELAETEQWAKELGYTEIPIDVEEDNDTEEF